MKYQSPSGRLGQCLVMSVKNDQRNVGRCKAPCSQPRQLVIQPLDSTSALARSTKSISTGGLYPTPPFRFFRRTIVEYANAVSSITQDLLICGVGRGVRMKGTNTIWTICFCLDGTATYSKTAYRRFTEALPRNSLVLILSANHW